MAVALSPGGNIVYVANLAKRSVQIVDLVADEVIGSIGVPGGGDPRVLALSSDGSNLFIGGPGGMWLLETESGKLQEVGSMDGEVSAISLPQQASLGYAAVANSIVEFDASTGSIVRTVKTSKPIRDLVASSDGRWLFLTQVGVDDLRVVDASSMLVTQQLPLKATPGRVVVTNNGSLLYVLHGNSGFISMVRING